MEEEVLEDQLKDKEHQRKMTRYLSSIGGKDLPDVVRRVLSAIATQECGVSTASMGRGERNLSRI